MVRIYYDDYDDSDDDADDHVDDNENEDGLSAIFEKHSIKQMNFYYCYYLKSFLLFLHFSPSFPWRASYCQFGVC